MPCLNEEQAIGACIERIQQTFDVAPIAVEIGQIVETLGARVTHEPIREYGNAYFTGFENARGKYLVTGDDDDIYDFTLIPQFTAPLEGDGCDFVTGSHSLGGGHGQSKGLHRSSGNPALTRILRAPSDFFRPCWSSQAVRHWALADKKKSLE